MHIVNTARIGLLKVNKAVASSDSTDTHLVSKPEAELSDSASDRHTKYNADRRHSLEALRPGCPNRGAGWAGFPQATQPLEMESGATQASSFSFALQQACCAALGFLTYRRYSNPSSETTGVGGG